MFIGKVQARPVSQKQENRLQKQGDAKKAESGEAPSFDAVNAGKVSQAQAVEAPKTREEFTEGASARSKNSLHDFLVMDVRANFKALGIVPPPSKFGGIRLDMSPTAGSPGSTEGPGQRSVMQLMMVKAVTARMSDRLQETQSLE